MRFVLLALGLLHAGCQARVAPVAKPLAAKPALAPDRVSELVALLPRGADRCLVLRPAHLSPEQRELFVHASDADGLAFVPELGVAAYAEAAREQRERTPARVELFWLAIAPERLRAWLEQRGAPRLIWEDVASDCADAACPGRARWLARNVLQIEYGAAAQGASTGAEQHCARMAARNPDAIELAYARSRALLSVGLGVMPLTVRSVVRLDVAGVHVQRFDLMRSSDDAAQVVADHSVADLLLGPVAALASGLRRTRGDAEVQTDYDLRWEDLALARDGERHLRAAEQEAIAFERAQAEPKQAPQRREEVLAQLGLLLERMRSAAREERRGFALEAQALLERALARDPQDEGLAFLLAELELSELSAPEAARALLQRFAEQPGARPRWPELQRHAAALDGVEALASALTSARLVQRRSARTVASDIVARMHEGAGYAEAERAALAQKKR